MLLLFVVCFPYCYVYSFFFVWRLVFALLEYFPVLSVLSFNYPRLTYLRTITYSARIETKKNAHRLHISCAACIETFRFPLLLLSLGSLDLGNFSVYHAMYLHLRPSLRLPSFPNFPPRSLPFPLCSCHCHSRSDSSRSVPVPYLLSLPNPPSLTLTDLHLLFVVPGSPQSLKIPNSLPSSHL